MAESSILLRLPRELRDEILLLVLFPTFRKNKMQMLSFEYHRLGGTWHQRAHRAVHRSGTNGVRPLKRYHRLLLISKQLLNDMRQVFFAHMDFEFTLSAEYEIAERIGLPGPVVNMASLAPHLRRFTLFRIVPILAPVARGQDRTPKLYLMKCHLLPGEQ